MCARILTCSLFPHLKKFVGWLVHSHMHVKQNFLACFMLLVNLVVYNICTEWLNCIYIYICVCVCGTHCHEAWKPLSFVCGCSVRSCPFLGLLLLLFWITVNTFAPVFHCPWDVIMFLGRHEQIKISLITFPW